MIKGDSMSRNGVNRREIRPRVSRRRCSVFSVLCVSPRLSRDNRSQWVTSNLCDVRSRVRAHFTPLFINSAMNALGFFAPLKIIGISSVVFTRQEKRD